MKAYNHIHLGLISIILFAGACQPGADSTRLDVNLGEPVTTGRTAQPAIEALSVIEDEGNYKLVGGDSFTLRVDAPEAAEVELFYQPITAVDRALLLQTIPKSENQRVFAATLRIPEDFNGEVWGRVRYPNGEVKETEHLLLAKHEPSRETASRARPQAETPDSAPSPKPDASDGDESARSDQRTGGGVQQTTLRPGNDNVRISVNVPAFRMTLWQDGREVKSNYVGVGRKNFPIPIGMRSADRIILNPDWIPPNSAWVRKSPNVEPYERISADDPNNPLGKIKIPLGQAYLLHEAQSTSDIGNLVSHGCIRVMRDDLFELTKMIARAFDLPISDRQIASAREDRDRRVIKLGKEIPVDINYDTMVVENGVLTIYPDVYDRNANTIDNLRAEFQAFDVDTSKLGDEVLKEMLDKVSSDQKFVIAIEEVKGNALEGRVERLIPR